MLVLTEAAAEVVKSVTSTAGPQGAGLRITAATPEPESPGELEVTATTGPKADDQVVEAEGARVFLEPQAAVYLEDKVLDARVDEHGNAHFSLGTQGIDGV